MFGARIDTNPAPGNKAGGLTTIYEKSLGALAKGGVPNKFIDKTNLQDAKLTQAQIADVVEFLNALTEPTPLKEASVP